MSSKNRFLDLRYVLNTIRIKTAALGLNIARGSYPFDYYKEKVTPVFSGEYSLSFTNKYEAFSYLDIPKAESLHHGEKSITQQLILALVHFNDHITVQSDNHETILAKADDILKKGTFRNDGLFFFINEPYDRFDVKGQYTSGIVQGKAASLFIRCYALTKDQKYLAWARQSLLAAWHPIQENGCLIQLPNNLIWVEEYPSPKPSMVLNGFLFYLIGLAEYVSLTQDEEVIEMLEQAIKSVLCWMPFYIQKNGLLYSMYRWNLCNVHYTGVMTYQFNHLYELTNVNAFKSFSDLTKKLTPWSTFQKLIQ